MKKKFPVLLALLFCTNTNYMWSMYNYFNNLVYWTINSQLAFYHVYNVRNCKKILEDEKYFTDVDKEGEKIVKNLAKRLGLSDKKINKMVLKESKNSKSTSKFFSDCYAFNYYNYIAFRDFSFSFYWKNGYIIKHELAHMKKRHSAKYFIFCNFVSPSVTFWGTKLINNVFCKSVSSIENQNLKTLLYPTVRPANCVLNFFLIRLLICKGLNCYVEKRFEKEADAYCYKKLEEI